MVRDDPVVLGALVVAAAFLPPIVYAIYIRNAERLNRNPWSGVFRAFFFGAVVSIVISIALEELAATGLRREYLPTAFAAENFRLIIIIVIAAPIVEEFAKALGVRSARKTIFEVEDGIIYGAAAGLGFSATENLIYELAALQENPGYTFVMVAAVRSVTSTFLHATATGIVGYGMARVYLERRMFIEVLPFYALAVLLHAGFNGLALTFEYQDVPLIGLLFIVFVSGAAIRWTVGRIRRLDRVGAPKATLR